MNPEEACRKPVRKEGPPKDGKKPVRKPEDKLKGRARLKAGGRKAGRVTVDLIKTSGHMARHPGKSAYVIATSSGEVVGEVTEGMLKGGGVVVRKSKNGMVLVKGSAEKISGAKDAVSKPDYYRRLLFFFGPLAALVLVYSSYFVFFPPTTALKLIGFAFGYLVAFFPGMDKNTLILLWAPRLGIRPYQMAINIWLLDSILGTFLCLNFDYVKRIPFIGKLVTSFEKKGKKILAKYPWLKRFTITGLFIFIVLPFQGSGGMAGSIIGRMVGLKPWKVIVAVVAGVLLCNLSLAFAADAINKYLPVWMQWVIPLIIIGLLVFGMIYTYVKDKKQEKDSYYQLYVKPTEEAEESSQPKAE